MIKHSTHCGDMIGFFNGTGLSAQLFSRIKGFLGHLIGLDEIEEIYSRIGRSEDGWEFLRRLMRELNIRYEMDGDGLSQIPRTGPVIVVANHPFGGVEGIVLASLLGEVRRDLKIMANHLLRVFPELGDLIIFVDPFGESHSLKRNIPALKKAVRWVQQGGMLSIFPAGEVASVNLKTREISDPTWSETCARIAQRTGAAVLPVYFPGANGPLFQLLGVIHPRWRTARLPRELLNKRGRTIRLKVGKLIPPEKLKSFGSDTDRTAYLRLRTYILKAAYDNGGRGIQVPPAPRGLRPAPLADPQSPSRMIREVDELPRGQVLLQSGEYSGCWARAGQIPVLLREIGRLRELTFRRASEGTGEPLDLDRFDRYYLHLFIWNHGKQEVVGAYRIGQTDRILKSFGQNGLYTSTLFKFKRGLLEQISPALELGRSFVRPEYQKSYSSLLLLWKGISGFVVQNPRYKILWGYALDSRAPNM